MFQVVAKYLVLMAQSKAGKHVISKFWEVHEFSEWVKPFERNPMLQRSSLKASNGRAIISTLPVVLGRAILLCQNENSPLFVV